MKTSWRRTHPTDAKPRSQSSQNPAGHLGRNSSHKLRVNIHPNPGKKDVRRSAVCRNSKSDMPLSLNALMLQAQGER